jgi:hypothetical protein
MQRRRHNGHAQRNAIRLIDLLCVEILMGHTYA